MNWAVMNSTERVNAANRLLRVVVLALTAVLLALLVALAMFELGKLVGLWGLPRPHVIRLVCPDVWAQRCRP